MADAVTQTFTVDPIKIGADSEVFIQYPAEFIASLDLTTGVLTAHFREKVQDDDLLFEASTANGLITRTTQSDGSVVVAIVIPATYSMKFPLQFVGFDLRRTVGADVQMVPGTWRWPTYYPYTR